MTWHYPLSISNEEFEKPDQKDKDKVNSVCSTNKMEHYKVEKFECNTILSWNSGKTNNIKYAFGGCKSKLFHFYFSKWSLWKLLLSTCIFCWVEGSKSRHKNSGHKALFHFLAWLNSWPSFYAFSTHPLKCIQLTSLLQILSPDNIRPNIYPLPSSPSSCRGGSICLAGLYQWRQHHVTLPLHPNSWDKDEFSTLKFETFFKWIKNMNHSSTDDFEGNFKN